MTFRIEKGVPLAPSLKGPRKKQKKESKHPFAKMKKGDSFLVPDALENTLRTLASQYGARLNVRFVGRKVENGLRIWHMGPRKVVKKPMLLAAE